jgi:hypothetical protein
MWRSTRFGLISPMRIKAADRYWDTLRYFASSFSFSVAHGRTPNSGCETVEKIVKS